MRVLVSEIQQKFVNRLEKCRPIAYAPCLGKHACPISHSHFCTTPRHLKTIKHSPSSDGDFADTSTCLQILETGYNVFITVHVHPGTHCGVYSRQMIQPHRTYYSSVSTSSVLCVPSCIFIIMDPDFYRSMTSIMGQASQRPEISEEQLAQVGDPSARKSPPDNNWTVYSPNILRGNMDQMKDLSPDDPRMSVGWKPNSEEVDIPDLGGGSMPITSPQSNWWGDMVVDEK